ncbi:hypothetical protein Tco_1515306 [Tanacetum coccineum]
MEESICYRCTLDVQRRSRYVIVVHYMFNGGVDVLSLYIRCSTEESNRKQKKCLDLRASATSKLFYGIFKEMQRNVECSNCKHLLDKITVLEAMLEMYKNPKQHTFNSAAQLQEVYNDMGKLDLE